MHLAAGLALGGRMVTTVNAKRTTRESSARPAIAFLPWVAVSSAKKIGGLRLIPYKRGSEPGDLPNVCQKDLDAVLGAYANRPRTPVLEATLMEIGRWRTGKDVRRSLQSLFRARECLRFAALSKRQLFRGHFGYCNSHTYELIVQGLTPGRADTFAFSTRRRDGSTSYLWGSDEFAFHRPLHVASNYKADFDQDLLKSLMALSSSESALTEAIVEFNAANTDSPDIPLHTEIVLVKSAFDWLLNVDHRAESFVRALLKWFPLREMASVPTGPLTPLWLDSRPKHGLLEAWAREFCRLRNSSAHGGARKGAPFVWSKEAHLAFTSVLFPLLVKKSLEDKNLYSLDDNDQERLAVIDSYLVFDPMKRPSGGQHRHPWVLIEQDARVRRNIEAIYEKMVRARARSDRGH